MATQLRDDPRKVYHGSGIVDPTTSDDKTVGFVKGSKFFNSVKGQTWICKDNTANAAIWKLEANDIKAYGFTGQNGTPSHGTLTGATVGQKVAAIFEATGGTLTAAALFESEISVADQIKQLSNTDLSSKKYIVLLV